MPSAKQSGTFAYDMVELGYNYRLPDVQCALGLAQLARLPDWLAARRRVAALYDDAFAAVPHATPLAVREGREHAYHLYVVRLAPADRSRPRPSRACAGRGSAPMCITRRCI